MKKMPDALHLLGESDALVRDHGFHASRGRPSAKNRDRCVLPYLAQKYGVTTRWIAKKLREGRRLRKSNPLVKSVSYQSGLAAAFAGVRSLPPTPAPAKVITTTNGLSSREALREALVGFLKNPGPSHRLTLDLSKALLDELRAGR